MKGWMTAVSVCVVLCIAGSAFAQCPAAKAAADSDAKVVKAGDKACDKPCTDKAKATGGTCNAVKVAYKIGDKSTCCPKEAGELVAKNEKAEVHYVINDKEYATRAEAQKAYATALEQQLGALTSVKETDGHFVLASYTFKNKEQAEKAAAAAKEAIGTVKVKYAVDGKQYDNDKAAQEACGKKTADGAAAQCHGEKAEGAKAEGAKPTAEKAQCTKEGGKATCSGSCGGKDKVALVELCGAKDCIEKCSKGKMVYVVGEQATCCAESAKIATTQAQIAAATAAIEKSGGQLAAAGA